MRKAGYTAAWVGQRTWNGVAILARESEIFVTRRKLPGDPKDKQSRYIEAVVDGIVVACLYAPNRKSCPGPRFDYKLAWLKRLDRHATMLRKTGAPIVIAGDFNVVPTPSDIYPTKSWMRKPCFNLKAANWSRTFWRRGGRMHCGICLAQ